MQLTESGDPTFRVLASSSVFSTFRNAFQQVTELPLVLAGRNGVDWGAGRSGTGICPNLKNGHPDCAGCLRFPESHQGARALTLQCWFGMVRTAVPLRVNGEVIAYLWTGWVSLDQPQAADRADDWEPIRGTAGRPAVSGGSMENGRRVVAHNKYSAIIEILASFASAVHPFTVTRARPHEAERCASVARALEIIAAEYPRGVSLRSVARRCNVTASYFSGLFRRSMNVTFTEYVTRFRVEKAKDLLVSSDQRISEIADTCGFGSHSQFNRAFYRLVGTNPRAFRAQSRSAA